MKIPVKLLSFYLAIHTASAIALSYENFSIKAFAITLLAISIVNFRNFKSFQNSFNNLYSWSKMDQELEHIRSIAGIQLSSQDLGQSEEFQKLKTHGRSLNHIINSIICGMNIYFLIQASPPSNTGHSIGLSLLIIAQAANNVWTLVLIRHFATLLFAAIFFKTGQPINLVLAMVFIFNFFIILKMLNQYFYQQLTQKKLLKNLEIEIPFRPITLFLSLFILLHILIPDSKSFFNLKDLQNKTKQIHQQQNALKLQIKKSYNNKVALDKIPPAVLKQCLQALPTGNPNEHLLNDLTQQQKNLETLLQQNQTLNTPTQEQHNKDLNQLKKEFEKWEHLNQQVWNKINQKEISLPTHSQKQIEDHPNFKSFQNKHTDSQSPPQQLPHFTSQEVEAIKEAITQASKKKSQKELLKTLENLKHPSPQITPDPVEIKNLQNIQNILKREEIKGLNKLTQVDKKTIQKLQDYNQKLTAVNQAKKALEDTPKEEDVFKRKQQLDQAIKKEKIEGLILEQEKQLQAATKKEKRNQKIKNAYKAFIKVVILLLVFFLFHLIYKFFKRDKIIKDDAIEKLSDAKRQRLQEMLHQGPKNFRSPEDEIIQCYQFFHQTMNELFYANDLKDYSPPPSRLFKQESLLSERLKQVAKSLAEKYIPLKYDGKIELSKGQLKEFRKNYALFMRLTKKMIKH